MSRKDFNSGQRRTFPPSKMLPKGMSKTRVWEQYEENDILGCKQSAWPSETKKTIKKFHTRKGRRFLNDKKRLQMLADEEE